MLPPTPTPYGHGVHTSSHGSRRSRRSTPPIAIYALPQNDNGYSWGDSNTRARQTLEGLERLADGFATRTPVQAPTTGSLKGAGETGFFGGTMPAIGMRGKSPPEQHCPRATGWGKMGSMTTRVQDDPFGGKWTHFSFKEGAPPWQIPKQSKMDTWGHPQAKVHVNARSAGFGRPQSQSVYINVQGESNHTHPLGNGTPCTVPMRRSNTGTNLYHPQGRAGGMNSEEWASHYQDVFEKNQYWKPDHTGGTTDRWEKAPYATMMGNRYKSIGHPHRQSYLDRYNTLRITDQRYI